MRGDGMTAPKTQGELDEFIRAKAADEDINPAIVARQYGLPLGISHYWWVPQSEDDTEDVYVDNIDLVIGYSDPLTDFVVSLAKSVQFPVSTAFVHSLGVMSAAMVENFYYRFESSRQNTVALYTVGAQPPSTGKSGINRELSGPAKRFYSEKKKQSMLEREKIGVKIGRLKGQLKKAKSDAEIDGLCEEIADKEEELKRWPMYHWAVNDPTPEGCEAKAAENNGFFNVISAESSAIKVILGRVYGDGASNNNIFLSAWDNEYVSVARGSREGYEGEVRGAMAVLAQDSALKAILEAGLDGEGVSERFLIIRERSLLGKRDHEHTIPLDHKLAVEYDKLMRNVCGAGMTTLTLSVGATNLVKSIRQEQEKLMGDGGRYSSPLLRGVVGKNGNQIIKIACVLHAAKEWAEGGNRRTEIQGDTVLRANQIFTQLLKTYVAAADSKGFTGMRTELEALIQWLTKRAGKDKLTCSLRDVRDGIKNSRAFAGIEKLTAKLKEEYLPELEKTAHVVFDRAEEKVFINPRLKQ